MQSETRMLYKVEEDGQSKSGGFSMPTPLSMNAGGVAYRVLSSERLHPNQKPLNAYA
jgi:hypothetical protein